MTRQVDKITTHFTTMIVRVKPAPYSGSGIFLTSDLDREAGYRVLATYMHRFPADGSTEPAFLLAAPDGTILQRACSVMQAVEIDGEPIA